MIRKIICFCAILIGIVSISFAGSNVNLRVQSLDIVREENNEIIGGFEVENQGEGYSSELFYIISLISSEQFKASYDKETTMIYQEEPVQFSLGAKEKKYIEFRCKLPENVYEESVIVNVSFTDKTSERGNSMGKSIKVERSTEKYLIPSDYENTHFWKEEGYTYPLSGPSFNVGVTPKAYINLQSTFDKKITVIPNYTVYKRITAYENKPYLIEKGAKVVFNPGETKELMLKLPDIKEPDSYLVKVELRDENDEKISNIYFFRYVVKGENAKILDSSVSYDSENSKILLVASCCGPADGGIISVKIEAEVCDKETKESIGNYNDEIVLASFPTKYMFEVPIKEIGKEMEAKLSITSKETDKILDSRTIAIEKKATEKINQIELSDINGTKYQEAVRKLIMLGIISGYPDGTFRPYDNITRAELTVIALNMKGIKKEDYGREENVFDDVSETYWARDIIAKAYKEGIINGYGDGTFMPENNVTYEEALTILLNVIGYRDEVIQSQLEWPNNYMEKARELKLLDVIDTVKYDESANRGDVANMTFGAYLLRR